MPTLEGAPTVLPQFAMDTSNKQGTARSFLLRYDRRAAFEALLALVTLHCGDSGTLRDGALN
jgi:hypothetical protein